MLNFKLFQTVCKIENFQQSFLALNEHKNKNSAYKNYIIRVFKNLINIQSEKIILEVSMTTHFFYLQYNITDYSSNTMISFAEYIYSFIWKLQLKTLRLINGSKHGKEKGFNHLWSDTDHWVSNGQMLCWSNFINSWKLIKKSKDLILKLFVDKF